MPYGFDIKFLGVLHAYANDRNQVTEVYSETLQIIYGVQQGSILGILLFNISLIDFFLVEHYK